MPVTSLNFSLIRDIFYCQFFWLLKVMKDQEKVNIAVCLKNMFNFFKVYNFPCLQKLLAAIGCKKLLNKVREKEAILFN